MTSVAVVSANGKVGRLVVEEAVKRGYDVTAVVRSSNTSAAQHVITKDLFALTADDLKGFDVVVSAFGNFNAEPDTFEKVYKHLADILGGTSTRLIVVGGAGSLYADKEHTKQIADMEPLVSSPYFALASSQRNGLTELRKHDDVNWIFISPAADFQAEGERKGSYTLAGEEFTTDADGNSAISYADYATALVDIIEQNKLNRERVSVRW